MLCRHLVLTTRIPAPTSGRDGMCHLYFAHACVWALLARRQECPLCLRPRCSSMQAARHRVCPPRGMHARDLPPRSSSARGFRNIAKSRLLQIMRVASLVLSASLQVRQLCWRNQGAMQWQCLRCWSPIWRCRRRRENWGLRVVSALVSHRWNTVPGCSVHKGTRAERILSVLCELAGRVFRLRDGSVPAEAKMKRPVELVTSTHTDIAEEVVHGGDWT